MNLGRLCQIILKSDEEIIGDGQLAQHAIFAYHMVRQTPLIALPPLRFSEQNHDLIDRVNLKVEAKQFTHSTDDAKIDII